MTAFPTTGSTSWGNPLKAYIDDAVYYSGKGHGAAGDGVTDDSTVLNALIQTAKVAGGVIYLAPGTYVLNSFLSWESNVSLVGSGVGRTILKPVGSISAIQRGGGVGTEITNCHFSDFEIDCSSQTGTNKGVFITYLKRSSFTRIYCHDSAASGLGCDFLTDVVFESCIVENAGRLGTTSSAGCSGFGIGTGVYATENVTLLNCIARNNKRYGAFFEKQSVGTNYSKGVQVIGGRYEGNFRGIGDNGVRRMIVNGAHVTANVDDGIYVGADQSTNGGYDGTITNCVVADNGGKGVHLDWTTGAANGRYLVTGCRVSGNSSSGIKVEATSTVPNVVISNNDVQENNLIGIQIAGAGTTDVEVTDNRVWSNGKTSVGGADMGILIGSAATRPRIVGNKSWDPAGTKTQSYGLQINGGVTVTGGSIADNTFISNLTGAFNLAGTIAAGASGTTIARNVGYNPMGWDALSPSASPWTYVAGPTEEVINLLNGTVSNVAVTDRTGTTTNVALSSPAVINLGPFDTMVVTYTVSPATKRLRK